MKLLKISAVIVLCAVAFSWGMLSYRGGFFPYPQIREAAVLLGFLPRIRVEVIPRTSQSARQRLATLGYLQQAEPDETQGLEGVTINIEEATFDGVNFYKEIGSKDTLLISNKGVEYFSWEFDPGASKVWTHSELIPDSGALIGLVEDDSIFRLSSDSVVEWRFEVRAHHDLQIRSDGSIWALTRKDARLPQVYGDRAIIEDYVTVLSEQGEIVEEFSLLQPLIGSPYEFLLPAIQDKGRDGATYDILHPNHIQILDGSLASMSPLYQEGNILVSFRTINSIAILDGSTHEILWLWGPTNLSVQHHAQVLDNGNILVFDNGFDETRIIEMSIANNEIVWEYSDGTDFFSSWGGSVQRLPNGNTLITNSARGIVFEVTPEGEKVWEFLNPRLIGAGRGTIWRMTRYAKKELSFLRM